MAPAAVLSVTAIVLLTLAASSVRLLGRHRRIVVIRDEKVARVVGPGLVFHVPLLERTVPVDLRPVVLDVPQEWLGATGRGVDPPHVLVEIRICDPAALVMGAARVLPDTWEALRSALAAELPEVSPVGAEEFERRLEAARVSANRVTRRLGIELLLLEVGEPIESESGSDPQIPPATNFE